MCVSAWGEGVCVVGWLRERGTWRLGSVLAEVLDRWGGR